MATQFKAYILYSKTHSSNLYEIHDLIEFM